MPFAVVGSNTLIEVCGKKARGRLYPWGVVEGMSCQYIKIIQRTTKLWRQMLFFLLSVENPAHCDFSKLRTMLM